MVGHPVSQSSIKPPREKPGDTITLPGGQRVRVLDAGTTEHLARLKDGERIVRNGFLIVGAR